MIPTNRIVELSSTIHDQTTKLDAYLTANNLPTPSFDISCPLKLLLPPDIQALRDAVLEATDELIALMLGPVESLIPPPNSWISVTALQRFKIASSFPPTETSTFGEIARACSIPESDCRRLMRHAMTFYIFSEPSPGIVAHTASSKALAEVPPAGAFIGFVAEEMLPASTRLVDAMQRWPGSEEPSETGFALTYATDVPMMQVTSADPRRAQQMGNAMSFLSSRPGENVRHLVDNFPFSAVGLLVDVGGAKGTVGMEIARSAPEIKVVVQDKPEVIKDTDIPEDLKRRLKLMGHDFFTEQPVKDADIYLIRNVLHDWSDKYAAKILRNLIPALKKGARVLVNDRCLPPPGALSLYKARQPRASDLYMKGIQNAKERDSADWITLFESVDKRFKHFEVISPPGSNCGLGKESARHFARLGASKLILAVRNVKAGEDAKQDIQNTTRCSPDVIEVWPLDLASNASIKTFADRVSKLSRVDVLLENAGISTHSWELVQGFERTIAVNVIGTFYLAMLILPKLKLSAEEFGSRPRLTVVSTEVHAWAKFPEWKEPNVFDALNDRSRGTFAERYLTSKLLVVLVARAIAPDLKGSGVILNVLSPGLCHSELAREGSIFLTTMKLFFGRTTEMGSRTLVAAALAGSESAGKYMHNGEVDDQRLSPFVRSEEGQKAAEKVWEELRAILDSIDPGITR
ncbi:hypothetical protein HYFRA_00009464 [Hymenoscyphus fraxineus]|uniref:O-methyltransferase C-terminal domain-containing protein n=1 Tax=Hymenoscyphus fraxineus TaxID=746836 RepID=A0A9N9L1U4_9HELO|nr:hypothetical protein HYFRA_00009464 [Hymenoscyphus fraxineus]